MDSSWSQSKIDCEQSSLTSLAKSTLHVPRASIKTAEVSRQKVVNRDISEGQSSRSDGFFWKPTLPYRPILDNQSSAAEVTNTEAPIPRCGSWVSHLTPQQAFFHGRSHMAQSSQWADYQRDETKIPLRSIEESSHHMADRGLAAEPVGTACKQDNDSSSPGYFQSANEEQIFDGLGWVESCHGKLPPCAWGTEEPSPLDTYASRDESQLEFPDQRFQETSYSQNCKEGTHIFPLPSGCYGGSLLEPYHGALGVYCPENVEQPHDFAGGFNMSGEEVGGPRMSNQHMCTGIQNWAAVVDSIEAPQFPMLCSDSSDCSPFSSGVYTQDTTMTPSDTGLPQGEMNYPQAEEDVTNLSQPSSSSITKEGEGKTTPGKLRPNSPRLHSRQRSYAGQTSEQSIARDSFLIECKLRGMSYRDIKKLGGFEEAESTLRGRYRTLTKRKELRVRKPQWQEKDVSSSLTANP